MYLCFSDNQIYHQRSECEAQIKGYPGAKYKKFMNAAEAEAFASGVAVAVNPGNFDASPEAKSKKRAMSAEVEDESEWDVVYSDGACKGNGQEGSYAGVGVWWGENDPR